MASSMLDEDQIPVDVSVDDTMIRVRFRGGLELATPVARFPRLQHAAPSKRTRWELIGRGYGIHWPDADEDISLSGLFATARKFPETPMEQVPLLISDLLKTTGRLNAILKTRQFTPESHLVGSIGEVVAEFIYDLRLESSSMSPDAYTKGERACSVEIKLVGKKSQRCKIRWPLHSQSTPEILLCLRMTAEGFSEEYNGPFPTELLEGKPDVSGFRSFALSKLRVKNPSYLPQVRSFASVNRWFQVTPELADVA